MLDKWRIHANFILHRFPLSMSFSQNSTFETAQMNYLVKNEYI